MAENANSTSIKTLGPGNSIYNVPATRCSRQGPNQLIREKMTYTHSIAELEEYHAFACGVARLAGNFLREEQMRRRRLQVLKAREKMNAVDLVTAADIAVERIIRFAL